MDDVACGRTPRRLFGHRRSNGDFPWSALAWPRSPIRLRSRRREMGTSETAVRKTMWQETKTEPYGKASFGDIPSTTLIHC